MRTPIDWNASVLSRSSQQKVKEIQPLSAVKIISPFASFFYSINYFMILKTKQLVDLFAFKNTHTDWNLANVWSFYAFLSPCVHKGILFRHTSKKEFNPRMTWSGLIYGSRKCETRPFVVEYKINWRLSEKRWEQKITWGEWDFAEDLFWDMKAFIWKEKLFKER